MYNINKHVLREFWKGRAVIEKEPIIDNNPGHVLGFDKNDEFSEVLIRVEFASGVRYSLKPDDLEPL